MPDLNNYIKGEETVIKTNRGCTMRFIPYFPKEEPEGLWEHAYEALNRMGVFDNIY